MKLHLTILLVLLGSVSFAQPYKIVNAINYLEAGDLAKAKEAIDEATVHDKTKESEKAWKIKGDVYYALYAKYKGDSHIEESASAYLKSLEISDKYKKELTNKLYYLGNFSLGVGVEKFNEKDYQKAVVFFGYSMRLSEARGFQDSLAIYNIALTNEKMENYDVAIEYYKKCIEISYKAEQCYGFAIYLLKKQGKNEEAITLMDEGRERYPDNIELMTSDVNLALVNGDWEKAVLLLDRMVISQPDNAVLFHSLGTAQQELGLLEDAEKNYLMAISLNPNYFDAYFNLGAMYFNQGVDLNNAMSEVVDPDLYLEKKEEGDAIFIKAIQPLEKALELQPNDRYVLMSLKQLYAIVGNTEKYKEVNEKLEN